MAFNPNYYDPGAQPEGIGNPHVQMQQEGVASPPMKGIKSSNASPTYARAFCAPTGIRIQSRDEAVLQELRQWYSKQGQRVKINSRCCITLKDFGIHSGSSVGSLDYPWSLEIAEVMAQVGYEMINICQRLPTDDTGDIMGSSVRSVPPGVYFKSFQ